MNIRPLTSVSGPWKAFFLVMDGDFTYADAPSVLPLSAPITRTLSGQA